MNSFQNIAYLLSAFSCLQNHVAQNEEVSGILHICVRLLLCLKREFCISLSASFHCCSQLPGKEKAWMAGCGSYMMRIHCLFLCSTMWSIRDIHITRNGFALPTHFFFLYLIPWFGKQELDPQRLPRNSHILPLVSLTNAFLAFGLVDLELTLQPSLITPEP